jgi:hypothetical protein
LQDVAHYHRNVVNTTLASLRSENWQVARRGSVEMFVFYSDHDHSYWKKILLHEHPLLGNVLLNKFPWRQILGTQSVTMLWNNRGSCVICRCDRHTNRLAG